MVLSGKYTISLRLSCVISGGHSYLSSRETRFGMLPETKMGGRHIAQYQSLGTRIERRLLHVNSKKYRMVYEYTGSVNGEDRDVFLVSNRVILTYVLELLFGQLKLLAKHLAHRNYRICDESTLGEGERFINIFVVTTTFLGSIHTDIQPSQTSSTSLTPNSNIPFDSTVFSSMSF